MKKFPFQFSLLPDLRMLNPAERLGYQDLSHDVVWLAKLFPQLQPGEKLDQLKTEAFDLQMAGDEDLPDTNNVDDFWAKLHQIRSPGSTEPTYSTLFAHFLQSLLTMLIVSDVSPWFAKSILKTAVTLSVAQLLPF